MALEQDEVYEDPGVQKENVEVSKFLAAIRKMKGAYAIKVHGDKFCVGEPDTVGSYGGRSFAIEWKRGPREKLKPIQVAKLRRWEQAFSIVGVYWRAEDALAALATYGPAPIFGTANS